MSAQIDIMNEYEEPKEDFTAYIFLKIQLLKL